MVSNLNSHILDIELLNTVLTWKWYILCKSNKIDIKSIDKFKTYASNFLFDNTLKDDILGCYSAHTKYYRTATEYCSKYAGSTHIIDYGKLFFDLELPENIPVMSSFDRRKIAKYSLDNLYVIYKVRNLLTDDHLPLLISIIDENKARLHAAMSKYNL
jgi:hypothetical protein